MSKKHILLFAIVVGLAVVTVIILKQPQAPTAVTTSSPSVILPSQAQSEIDQRAAKILDERKTTDETVWAKEVKAQKYEEYFINVWNHLLNSSDKLEKLSSNPFGELVAGHPGVATDLAYGVKVSAMDKAPVKLDGTQLKALAESLKKQGIELKMSEWHHGAFDTFADGTAESKVSTTLYLEQPSQKRRWILKGTLDVKWPVQEPGKELIPQHIDATKLTLMERQGPLAFEEIPSASFGETDNIPAGGTLLVYDLNHDGLDDILLPARNRIYWNKGNLKFEPDTLFSNPGQIPLHPLGAAVAADFNGDGQTDLMLSTKSCALALYLADSSGKFTTPGRAVFTDSRVTDPSVMTAGDINGDGRLDIWLAQYRQAYQQGQMPTPYFDANDGYPSFLLLNQGDGNFADATEESGLSAKRFRRTYSSSFVDLDDDQDLDLLVVSDFSGVDVYRNDGQGRFTDITSKAVDERANFGMSHVFADFNRDGKLDFFVTGMSSTTARRLEYMKLGRKDFPEYQKMRMPMGYGNRLYLRQADGSYHEPAWRDMVARSGWSWGCTAFDFANDGRTDLYIANGHISGKTTRDYCTRFWTQDIYTGSPKIDMSFVKVMKEELNTTRDWSWNGYEKKALFLEMAEDKYVNASFLMGTAFQYDGRHVISSDLDNDGREDLLIVEQMNSGKPNEKQVLHALRNTYDTRSNWIGFRFNSAPGFSPVGARIELQTDTYQQAACLANGDSFDSQHPLAVHYGLGDVKNVKAVKVYWANGKTSTITRPAINQYHVVAAAK